MTCNWHSLSKFHSPCQGIAVIKDSQGIHLCAVHFKRLTKKHLTKEQIDNYIKIKKPAISRPPANQTTY